MAGVLTGMIPKLDAVSTGIAIAQALEATAEKGAKQLADDIEANNENRERALSKAEKLIESMRTETGPALTAKQKEVATLLSVVAAPSSFGKTRMTGMQARQIELESMSTNFSETTMKTLKPYGTNEELVAGKYSYFFSLQSPLHFLQISILSFIL